MECKVLGCRKNTRPNRTRTGADMSASRGSSEDGRVAGKQNERKFGMIMPSSNDRENKSVENEQKNGRLANKLKNQRTKHEERDRSQKEEKKFEIINFGLV